MSAVDTPYEAPSVEEIADGDCPIETSSMVSIDN
jgi:hypothetical protein